MSDIIIKNGHLIDPSNNIDKRADIHISGGKITAITDSGSLQVDGGQPAAAIKALDGALYLSKQLGRNRVETSDEFSSAWRDPQSTPPLAIRQRPT